MKAPIDIEKLTRQAIEAHLESEPSEEERETLANVRAWREQRGWVWDQWHNDEARRLFAEEKLGLDHRWKRPTADMYPDEEWQALCREYDAAFPDRAGK